MLPVFEVQIGIHNWEQEIRDFTNRFDSQYWSRFTQWTAIEIDACERQINRKLPDDFRLFLLQFGSGSFLESYGGNIYTPDEICLATPGPMWMIFGSSDWASDEDHRRLYATRGQYNPLSKYVAKSQFIRDGISLFDLLQVGTDGNCNYHQINVSNAKDKTPFGYCLLTPDPTFEHKLPSFSAGLSLILSYHEALIHRPEEAVDLRGYDCPDSGLT